MTSKTKTRFLVVFLAGTLQVAAQVKDIAVAVNPSNSTSSLSLGELRKIFSGEKRLWGRGMPIKLLTRAPGTRERTHLLKLLKFSESDYKQYWTAQIYRGAVQSGPITLPSNGMQKEALNTYPGAIALVDAADLKPGMKVLKIDGFLPGEEGYPLH